MSAQLSILGCFPTLLLSLQLHTGALRAQAPCGGQGSARTAATWERGPGLQCSPAPTAVAWHLFTPAHRQVVAKQGFRQGDAQALPRILISWRCTGWLFAPVAVDRIRTMGYVLDVAEVPCTAPMPITP